jgi:hypothetical protein
VSEIICTSRRGFLGLLGVALASPAIVKISSLMPISMPKIVTGVDLGGKDFTVTALVRGNHLLTINQITRESIKMWKNTNKFMITIDRQFDEYFPINVGDKLRIKLPSDYSLFQ